MLILAWPTTQQPTTTDMILLQMQVNIPTCRYTGTGGGSACGMWFIIIINNYSMLPRYLVLQYNYILYFIIHTVVVVHVWHIGHHATRYSIPCHINTRVHVYTVYTCTTRVLVLTCKYRYCNRSRYYRII